MTAVLSGFTVVWLIIAVGFLVGRMNILGKDARVVLSRTAFFVASPCLLFVTIADSEITDVLGAHFWVAGISAFLALFLYVLVGRFLLPGRRASELVIGSQSASQVNAANLGFPIAMYVLGDISLAAPVVMFQLAIYMPILVGTLDQLTIKHGSTTKVRPGRKVSVLRRVLQTVGNPVIVGAFLGLLFSWQGWRFPVPVQESVELLAAASIPLLLLAFGLALVGSHPLDKASGRRRDVLFATLVKLVLHPGIAYLVAAFLFGLEGTMLFAAVIMASLPTAQNVLVTAVRYETGETVARDTVLITTVLGIPSMILVALLLA
ncbi:AEC family transporter [Nesterenkonia flava]|uniref:AEC family transporter n=1 Tax=Nesterenkonia flava TaxID=469799 RepID=A0ABU1FVR8_9MICC|nr:AEC family transporter [Nesterenkonia flava]MDR5712774.1 AEC family transporter [Nesterenkonia flava]